MDLMSTAQLLGNFGEFVGAIAVVATLGYLAIQVRNTRTATESNTSALRSSTYAAYIDSANEWCHFAGQHSADLAAIGQLSSLDQLDERQALVWQANLFLIFNLWESTYLHHRAGSLDQDVYKAKVRAFQQYIDFAPIERLMRQSWEANRSGYTEEFQKFMDSQVIGARPTAT